MSVFNSPTGWLESEVGDYVRGLNTIFNGSQIEDWKNETQAAAFAGEPYPWYTPELKRWMLDYFIGTVGDSAIQAEDGSAILTEASAPILIES